MATCDKCGRTTDKVFERGIWLCRECYPKEVLKPDVAEEFDPENTEQLADVLLDDYWSENDYVSFRRNEDE